MEEVVKQRIWAKVEKFDTCWVWTAARDQHGYGRFRLNGRTCFAHRLVYEMLVGPIPGGMEIDHRCRNPPCVRPGPGHCEPVTHAENVRLGHGNAWQRNAVKTHCKQGHPYDDANTYVFQGKRQCRACAVVTKQRYADKIAAAKPPPPPRVVKTHCPQGHEYTPENTYVNQGRRNCRLCKRVHARLGARRRRARAKP